MSLSEYRQGKHRPDWTLALLAVGLSAFGLTMILSASAYLAGLSGNLYQYVVKQAISLGIGLIVMFILSQVDYRVWKQIAGPIAIVILVCLLIVFVFPACRGTHRCVDLGPLRFQPAELVKLGFLMYLSAWLAALGSKIKLLKEGYVRFLVLIGVVGGLILLEPDMGTSMTLVITSIILFFLAGAPLRYLGLTAGIGVVLVYLLILVAPYRAQRLETFLNPSSDPQGAGYHTNQVMIAIGSGGWWGLGFGHGKLKELGYVPEVHTDSIFAVVVEELGFVRATVVLLVYLYLLNRGYRIAKTAPDPFGRYLAASLITLIGVQAFINLGAMMGLIPLTGIPLPLVSYGGTSLIAILAALGIVLSVSRYTVKDIPESV